MTGPIRVYGGPSELAKSLGYGSAPRGRSTSIPSAGSSSALQQELAELRAERDQLRVELEKVTTAEGPYGVVIRLKGSKAVCCIGGRQFSTVPIHEHANVGIGDAVRFAKTEKGLMLAEIIEQPLEACPIVTVTGLHSGRRFECNWSGLARTCRLGKVKHAAEGDRIIVDPDGQVGLENLGPQTPIAAEPKAVGWDDVGGLEDAKRELREAIEDPIIHKDLYRTFKLKPLRGILLAGPPGGGKTLLARAAATALARMHGVSAQTSGFLLISGPQAVLNKYVGESEANIQRVFAAGREHYKKHGYPAILVVDECDALLGARGVTAWDGMTRTIVPTFLTEMDGVDTRYSPLVILITNRPDILDEAIVRPGRIDRIIHIGYPDEKAARQIIEIHVGGRPVEDGFVAALFASVKQPASGAVLENDVNRAIGRAVRRAKVDGDMRLLIKDTQ